MADEGAPPTATPPAAGGGAAPGVIIIKKKNRGGGHGHHGGAWKVAYADFVTAMMAFFLLLWLLATSSEAQKTGIANYFNPPNNSTEFGGGAGIMAGASAVEAPQHAPTEAPPLPQKEDANQGDDLAVSANEDALFRNVAEEFKKALMNVPELQTLVENMIIDITPEGLRIQVTDTPTRSLYVGQTATMEPGTERMASILAAVLAPLPNRLALGAHTDVVPLRSVQPGYTNWELSADRAQTLRKTLVREGVPERRVARVAGHAGQEPLLRDDPTAAKNRRISLTVLRAKRSPVTMFSDQGLIAPQAGEAWPQ
jgi:chemotaxis protein MotB